MTRFSANLGFLWADRPLPAAIHAAKAAGFAAVECHWPYDTLATEVASALSETGLEMLGINTRRGDVSAGENGLSAVPGRQSEAQMLIAEAVNYAAAIGAKSVHVMAGNATGVAAHSTFIGNLRAAARTAAAHGLMILIEPLNRHDAPKYFLRTTDQAREIIEEVGEINLKLMFDCYHVGRTEGDIETRFRSLAPLIGHIQFASVPDRGAPDHGEINYAYLFASISKLGWTTPLGAEYRPVGDTDKSLNWMKAY